MTGAPAAWLQNLLDELAFHPAGPAGPWTLGAVSGPAGVEVDVAAGTVRVVTTEPRILLWERRLDPAGPPETGVGVLAAALAYALAGPVASAVTPGPVQGSEPAGLHSEASGNGKSSRRFGYGKLQDAALGVLARHPASVFTVRELAHATGSPRSRQSLRNALRIWVEEGKVRQFDSSPPTYQITGQSDDLPTPYTGPDLLTGRVRYGETASLVLRLMQAHPTNTFTTPRIMSALGGQITYPRVSYAMKNLVAEGAVRVLSGTYPIRYQAVPVETVPPLPAGDTPHDREENTVAGPRPQDPSAPHGASDPTPPRRGA